MLQLLWVTKKILKWHHTAKFVFPLPIFLEWDHLISNWEVKPGWYVFYIMFIVDLPQHLVMNVAQVSVTWGSKCLKRSSQKLAAIELRLEDAVLKTVKIYE